MNRGICRIGKQDLEILRVLGMLRIFQSTQACTGLLWNSSRKMHRNHAQSCQHTTVPYSIPPHYLLPKQAYWTEKGCNSELKENANWSTMPEKKGIHLSWPWGFQSHYQQPLICLCWSCSTTKTNTITTRHLRQWGKFWGSSWLETPELSACEGEPRGHLIRCL